MRWAALALKTAVIGSPSARPRSAAERAVTVATSGKPTSTTTRVAGADGTRCLIVPVKWLRALDRGACSVGRVSVTSSGRMPSLTRSPGRPGAAGRNAEPLEPAADPRLARVGAHAAEGQAKPDVLGDRHVGEERLLEHHRHPAPLGERVGGVHQAPAEAHAARGRPLEEPRHA